MVIKKITRGKYKGYWGVYHCHHGHGLIKAFKTKKKATAMHTAIILSEMKRGTFKPKRRVSIRRKKR